MVNLGIQSNNELGIQSNNELVWIDYWAQSSGLVDLGSDYGHGPLDLVHRLASLWPGLAHQHVDHVGRVRSLAARVAHRQPFRAENSLETSGDDKNNTIKRSGSLPQRCMLENHHKKNPKKQPLYSVKAFLSSPGRMMAAHIE
ncbi:hypothetical protein V6N11_080589 [Hibiscus sabdariffa]|uniref:Uncharacterized protein n=1 Tax=Hibiscus sabdariffa TaxID=183260 RepID=A0ABR2R862_9ROSI